MRAELHCRGWNIVEMTFWNMEGKSDTNKSAIGNGFCLKLEPTSKTYMTVQSLNNTYLILQREENLTLSRPCIPIAIIVLEIDLPVAKYLMESFRFEYFC